MTNGRDYPRDTPLLRAFGLQRDLPEERMSEVVAETVDSPSHYTAGKYETIDVIEHIVTGYDDPFVAHCVGTATKYLDRAPYKHGDPTEDLRKAAKYLEFAIKRLDGEADE